MEAVAYPIHLLDSHFWTTDMQGSYITWRMQDHEKYASRVMLKRNGMLIRGVGHNFQVYLELNGSNKVIAILCHKGE